MSYETEHYELEFIIIAYDISHHELEVTIAHDEAITNWTPIWRITQTAGPAVERGN